MQLPFLEITANEDTQANFEALQVAVTNLSAGGSGASTSGDLKASAVAVIPVGWLLCDGSLVSRTTYAALFAALASTYGAGDGSTTFGIPDLRGMVLMGASALHALASSGGEEQHSLSTTEMPSHGHGGASGSGTADLFDPSHTHLYTVGGAAIGGGIAASTPSVSYGSGSIQSSYTGIYDRGHTHSIPNDGGGGSHNNLQPFVAVNWLIKV